MQQDLMERRVGQRGGGEQNEATRARIGGRASKKKRVVHKNTTFERTVAAALQAQVLQPRQLATDDLKCAVRESLAVGEVERAEFREGSRELPHCSVGRRRVCKAKRAQVRHSDRKGLRWECGRPGRI